MAVTDEKVLSSHVEGASDGLELGDITVHIDEIENTSTGKFTWLVASAASIGGFLCGYNTGIISAVLVYINNDLGHALSSSDKELITSLRSAGAFVGAMARPMRTAEKARPISPYFASVLFTVGAIIQAAAFSLPQMAGSRLIVGFGVGAAAMIVPLYLTELAPTKFRGRMVGLNKASITGGQVISYAIGAGLAHAPNGSSVCSPSAQSHLVSYSTTGKPTKPAE
ncbi:hypothetical protein LQW54_012174 [Pestalotiopsis sp. IQ-011]